MVATVPTMPAQSEDGEDCPGPTFDKAISQPDPIPEEGRARAMELMESGALFRYSPGFLSETSLAEADMVDRTRRALSSPPAPRNRRLGTTGSPRWS